MKRLLLVLVLVAAGVVGLGFYRGWFRVGSENADGKSNVTLSVDRDKIHNDEKAAVANVQGVGQQIHDKIAGPSEKALAGKDAAIASSSHDGNVVSIIGDKLVMTNTQGAKEHAHTLAATVNITCDGKACKATDLKPGMRIRVTTENAEPHAATRIEALDNNQGFEKGSN